MKINLHTHQFTNHLNVLDIVNQYPDSLGEDFEFFSIGIHPWYINLPDLNKQLAIIESHLSDDSCLALGECGLDKRIETTMETQILVFESQLLLAEKYQKPVLIHCVSAFQELLEVKKRLKLTVPFLIHGFSKNRQVMEQLLHNNCFISFGKYLLQNDNLVEVFKNVPDDRYFLETDMMENALDEVYEKAARIKELQIIEVEQQIENTARKVFEFSKKLRNTLG
ncbi:TatD family hydrolase [Flavobacterium sp. HSC-61S13]|uniref:TatD family hydrolase n=1 Tax=Flavobacterium sp. HSC-61S13 TaxID=2910963 RepID=UPI00209D3D2F|nr:TatD family hydrolase [Flavobacterium sp. HSC-61S13]MCP1997554.1 TatD DNase family protein [Flavobacterium sp. HSC-61S13]